MISASEKENIRQLMTDHSSFRDYLNEAEYEFINSLIKQLSEVSIKLPLNYQIRGSMINFKIGSYQIG